MRQTLPAAIALALLGAVCSPTTKDPSEFSHAELNPIPLAARVLVDYGHQRGMVTSVSAVGDYLVLVKFMADSIMELRRAQDGALIRKFGSKGDLPGQFSGAWSVVPGWVNKRSERVFWVYDVELQRLTEVDLGALVRGSARWVRRIVSLRSPGTTVDPIWLSDSLIAALGTFEHGRIAQFDLHGTEQREVGALPPGQPGTPVSVTQHAFIGSLAERPDHSELVLLTRYASHLDFYTPNGSLVTKSDGPYRFEPQYHSVRAGGNFVMATGKGSRFGYIAAVTTDSVIVALFSGRLEAAFPGKAHYGRFLHIFDWSGRFLRAAVLDTTVLAIAMDPGSEQLYAVRGRPTNALLVYSLGGILARPMSKPTQ